MNMKKLAVIPAIAVMLLTACGGDSAKPAANSGSASADAGNTFIISLYPEYAPITCDNFENLVKSGFYDGLTFHRVMDNFMAQGGDPQGTGRGGSGHNIKGEFKANGVNNELKHTRGIVSMARSRAYDSASSQFFICYTTYPSLDGNYAAFGEVTEGMEVVDSFLQVERVAVSTDGPSSPTQPIVIDNMKMIDDDKDGHHRVQVTMKEIPVKK